MTYNFKIHDLFKIVPLDDDERNRLLSEYDTYDDDRKFELQEILWDAFHEMTEQLTDIKYQSLLNEVQAGTRDMATDLYQEAHDLVIEDYIDILNGKREEVEKIDKIRTQLKTLMQDQGQENKVDN